MSIDTMPYAQTVAVARNLAALPSFRCDVVLNNGVAQAAYGDSKASASAVQLRQQRRVCSFFTTVETTKLEHEL